MSDSQERKREGEERLREKEKDKGIDRQRKKVMGRVNG
jgi:hypothetical protein